MKRCLYSLLLLALGFVGVGVASDKCCRVECTPRDSCDYQVTSHSYLSVRPHFLSHSPEMLSGFRSDRLRIPKDGRGCAVEGVLFGSGSTNEHDLARYFFPFGKTVLVVDERIGSGSTLLLEPQDLLSTHFNIFTVGGNFRSKISIRPKQTVVGFGLYARKSFWVNEERGRGFYASLSLPLERVKNDVRFVEEIINNGRGPNFLADKYVMANMTEAFMQSEWMFGKIDKQPRSRIGVADMEAKIGYEWIQQEPFHLESYVGVLIPTGRKPSAEFLFDPVVGQGRHVGFLFGNHMGFEVWKDEAENRSLRIECSGHAQYLLKNTQCRSVDLIGKPWSRYIEMYRDEEQATVAANVASAAHATHFATPGINLLTLPLKVRPGFSHNLTTAFVLQLKDWIFEGGYNLYCRQAECVKLACPWSEGPAIKNQRGEGYTNPVRDMTGNYRLEIDIATRITLSDYKFNMIKEKDLDLLSAASPCLISHTVYSSVGYRWDDRDWPIFGNIGGSYEFPRGTNAGIERWTLWAKFGVSM